jgi:hypothetical protein
MYEILTGKQRGLVFPVMCNGHVAIDYNENIVDSEDDSTTTNDVAYGLWAHEDSFTFESVITPYEINGHGTYSSLTPPSYSSKKVMPALAQSVYTAGNESNFQSELYLSRTARLTHEMMIFYNTNFQVSLLNSTLHNENEPARYKIRVRLKLGTSTETYTTNEGDDTVYDVRGFDPDIMLPDEDVYVVKKKEKKEETEGLETFMETDKDT